MPIYEFQAGDNDKSCDFCRDGFEQMMRMSDPPPANCPKCGNPVVKKYSVPSVGASKSGFNDRAKAAGFHQLKKISKGEYEKTF